MFFATDIANFFAGKHIATLNREQQEGKISKKAFADPGSELLRKLGLEHELKYLNQLKASGLRLLRLQRTLRGPKLRRLREATVQGVDVVYQATFVQS